jgi:hypothetical protein
MKVRVLLALTLILSLVAISTPAGAVVKTLRFGMFNIPTAPVPAGYCTTNGVKVAVLEMSWASAEPTDDAWSTSYFNTKRAQYDAWNAAGCKVVLANGLQTPPAWMQSKPNAKYLNQDGTVYTGSTEVDLVSNVGLRPEAEEYTLRVFQEFGPSRDFFQTRVGGNHWGELGYPPRQRTDGLDDYWAFNALATDNPVPAYRPCTGLASQAGTFANWYINRITGFQNWQLTAVYAAKANLAVYADPGVAAVLYPGNNMTEAEITSAIAGNLCSTTVAENDGKFSGGHMWARQINGVPAGTDIAAWGTWANNTGNTSNAVLDNLADARGFDVAYENSGPGSVAKVQPTEDTCRSAFSDGPSSQDVTCYWIRYGDPGTAEYVTAIASNP